MSTQMPTADCDDRKADRQFVTALARGLDILRCFDRPKVELTVSEIARRVGLSQPTVWRLCYTLLDRGYLVRAPTGPALRIGAPAITLGYAAASGMDAPAIATPYMQRLLDETGGSATLSMRQGGEMVAVEQINGDFVVRNQPVGWRAPLDAVSSGLAILSALPEAEREEALASIESPDAERQARHLERVTQARRDFTRDGAVRLTGILEGRYTAVAVPLFEAGTAPPQQWAMTCGGLTGGWTESGIGDAEALLVEIRGLLMPAFAALRA